MKSTVKAPSTTIDSSIINWNKSDFANCNCMLLLHTLPSNIYIQYRNMQPCSCSRKIDLFPFDLLCMTEGRGNNEIGGESIQRKQQQLFTCAGGGLCGWITENRKEKPKQSKVQCSLEVSAMRMSSTNTAAPFRVDVGGG